MKKQVLMCCICLLVMASESQAQKMNMWSIGVGAGISNYFGDLAPKAYYPSTKLGNTRFGFSAEIAYRFTPRLTAELELGYVQLQGSDNDSDPRNIRDRYRYLRNTHFRNNIKEASLLLEYDLIPIPADYGMRDRWRPYIFAGITGFLHNPKAKDNNGNWVDLQPLGTEGQNATPGAAAQARGITYNAPYKLFNFAIPFGAGVSYRLNRRTDLSFEVSYRYTFTDYLDDVSGNYADARDLAATTNGALALELSNRTAFAKDPLTGSTRSALNATAEGIGGFVTDELGRPTVTGFGQLGDQRGNAGDNDVYLITGFRLSFALNVRPARGSVSCPEFRKR
jgi:hypothetical protein